MNSYKLNNNLLNVLKFSLKKYILLVISEMFNYFVFQKLVFWNLMNLLKVIQKM